MIVHRLLDVFFRTLDTVDAVRDRVDRVLGREPRPDPWAVDWPPPDAEMPAADAAAAGEEAAEDGPAASADDDKPKKAAASKKSGTTQKKTSTKKKATTKKKAGRKKAGAAGRKGSVDRSGKDLVSPRADLVEAKIKSEGWALISEDADHGGKKVLGRTLWALQMAHQAGETEGLTTNDVSALLSRAANIEVFATNIGRACRDHSDLIEAGEPDGRSKRYHLTEAGRTAASEIATRS